MNIYNYHPESRVFLGAGLADPSPLEPDVWLVPAHATTRVPPPLGPDEVAVFDLGLDVWVIQAAPPPPPPGPPAPPPPEGPVLVVEMAQARLALLQAGLLSDVEAAIDALEEPMRTAARIEWEYRANVRRDSPLTLFLAAGLGLTETQLDELFQTASGL
jgi:hypothetical protein